MGQSSPLSRILITGVTTGLLLIFGMIIANRRDIGIWNQFSSPLLIGVLVREVKHIM
jgi:hypothetical protein